MKPKQERWTCCNCHTVRGTHEKKHETEDGIMCANCATETGNNRTRSSQISYSMKPPTPAYLRV
ncbi:hypothetical protein COV49_00880 [Candidatus Falkowbacteria bacterium CG11_big_fil_rev_8_21_14_0_20_39_10]|uniref:Uncharacterized protein n=1 Tax=Candidatus Falkowbacteria bacterium CG11_big_fil_rev_8_21_14_0_20_39_10 TaxID=1974570 RepID=A0A2M6KA04_9BACT|nr:MAG: hypothetical protein COV49_00880 [Candidatus Falkowbacteria bacterium CG11_big_fil_rev_8_21_14_0_20_39_10]